MKPDISTLLKPDILTLQRHAYQLGCIELSLVLLYGLDGGRYVR
jgi:hypothetical protein